MKRGTVLVSQTLVYGTHFKLHSFIKWTKLDFCQDIG